MNKTLSMGLAVLVLGGVSAACSSGPDAVDETPTADAVEESALASPRLYVIDCGFITAMDPENYDLRVEEVAGTTDFFTPCYLVEHPNGTLMWELGQIPDADFPEDGSMAAAGVFMSPKPLLPQLAEIGHTPSDITYVAMSHYHTDHSANANSFAGSTWLVQQVEHDAMFGEEPAGLSDRANYAELEHAETMLLDGDDYDVFGDGSVVIKSTPGHTPGHQSLFVNLANRGPVLLAGDLYHYVEERTLDRVPGFDFDAEATRRSRQAVEEFLTASGAELWIEHNIALNDTLDKSPAYYD
jgi:glyoxylase-like metal-dependent hydrolase (beta-lactamase superfamily II)